MPDRSPTHSVAAGLATKPRRTHRRRDLVLQLVVAGVVVLAVGGLIVYLANLRWSGTHQSPAALAILQIQVIGGLVPVVVFVLAGASVLFLLVRRPTRGRIIAGSIGLLVGALVGVVGVLVFNLTAGLGALPPASTAWSISALAVVGLAIASFWTSRGWRVFGVAATLVAVVTAATLGIDADYDLDPTVGTLLGVSSQKTIALPPIATPSATPTPSLLAGGALWANWFPPATMPAQGSESSVEIPGTISGFAARPAGLYLPPAALVPNPPALPLVIFMMGQPGNPDPEFQTDHLEAFAAKHNGLAPIVIVADQIGNPSVDPLCLDVTRYGKAETYITQDVVEWARTHLHILQDAAHWTIGGYSNGGECAVYFGAKYPSIWGNVLDISGERYPGSTVSSSTLSSVFHGDSAAYQATWPTNIMQKNVYPDTFGIFTVGSNDSAYRPIAADLSNAAKAAGWNTTYYEIPNGGHVLDALNGGLQEGYTLLYPRLGLSQPGTTP